jgi:hypothetical protein
MFNFLLADQKAKGMIQENISFNNLMRNLLRIVETLEVVPDGSNLVAPQKNRQILEIQESMAFVND